MHLIISWHNLGVLSVVYCLVFVMEAKGQKACVLEISAHVEAPQVVELIRSPPLDRLCSVGALNIIVDQSIIVHCLNLV